MIPIPFALGLAVALIALMAAMISRRPALGLPAATIAAGANTLSAGLAVNAGLIQPAFICVVGTLAAAVVFVMHLNAATQPIHRAPGRCPGWCDVTHGPLLDGQRVISHEAPIASTDLDDGGLIEVRVGWMEHLAGPAGDPPVVMLTGHGWRSTDIEMTPDEAATLAALLAADLGNHLGHGYTIAISGDAGWLPQALAEAAETLGCQPAPLMGGAA